MWRWHCTKEWTDDITKTFYFYKNSKHFFVAFVCFWCMCVRARVWSTHANGSWQLYGCSSIIQMCFIRPITKILQFQLAHLHEPIFITSPTKAETRYHLSVLLLLHSCLRVCICVLYFSTIFGVGALAFITLRFSLFLSLRPELLKCKNETLTEKLHDREHKHQQQHWKQLCNRLNWIYFAVCVSLVDEKNAALWSWNNNKSDENVVIHFNDV